MDETTTTETATEQTAEEQTSQAENPEQQPAEASTTETQPDQETGKVDAGEETQPEDINLDWLGKTKGVDVNDPKAVAEAWRKAEQEFHKSRQETKALQTQAEQAVQTGDPSQDRLAVLETRMAVRDFYDTHPDARALDDRMGEIIEARPHLAVDLEAVYAIAKLPTHSQSQGTQRFRGDIPD